ncbi:outer membrane usher protein [Moellerella wisconsensis]|uniref:Fimbrial usher protein n=1 Tax=Moellerella wisconsensis ATCC 35017 TaxID=1354267 RepID=A0A0N0IBX7_9GAMM|nr:outer membrane usher protein [Moellerella wisconsensis]KPD04190.1 fimbrial usher protein [Moellerella wisconsensis ATCC 35017]VFS52297.1 Outer membrane usher protein papC precursor [Moellerella wisconsensis]
MSLSKATYFRLALLSLSIAFALDDSGKAFASMSSDVIQFNTDVLDVEDKKNINLDHFSRAGYMMPGTYSLVLKVNDDALPEVKVPFYAPENDPQGSVPCLSPDITRQLGLTPDSLDKLTWWHDGQCANFNSLPGLQVRGDLSTSSLYVSIPQAYMEYVSPNWDPPSRWDEGISAIILDYNINGNTYRPHNKGHNTYTLNGNGVAGVNLGAWRFRADWQGRLNHATGSDKTVNRDFQWNRFYAFRALPAIGAKLILGEDYLNSNMFDSFRFIGASLRSDLNMLPPNLRGYAPEVTGIAQSNATVTISQQGRVIYTEQVAPGPFRIQNLSDAISGTLDVKVQEQDGTVQEYQLDTANLPYLTRPGQIQYKLALGQPNDVNRNKQGDNFVTGELSWGINNGWSLFSGLIGSKDYQAISAGLGRDLLAFGALSFDITQSFARLAGENTINGGSYRVSYAKRFDAIDSQIQFAGYRFSERNFMSMSDFLQATETGIRYGGSKELYTISLNKNFRDVGMSMYLNYNHQTYWDRSDNNYYSLTLSKYFDVGAIRNISVNLSANRSMYNGVTDDSIYLSTSFPLSNGANMGYSLNSSRYDTVNRVTYHDRIDERTNYQLGVGSNRKGASGTAYLTHQGDTARVSGNASYANNQYTAFGLSAMGGITLTAKGAGIHRMSMPGGTRLMVDTDGVANVPVKGFGAPITTNHFGKAIVGDVNSYYRSKAQIDLNALPDDVDAQQSVVQVTLTEGAVGYREFKVVSGQKAMTVLRLSDGSYPPFGAQILNAKGQSTGIVGDSGSAYISGIEPNSQMKIQWGEDEGCQVSFPENIDVSNSSLLLMCTPLAKEITEQLAQR